MLAIVAGVVVALIVAGIAIWAASGSSGGGASGGTSGGTSGGGPVSASGSSRSTPPTSTGRTASLRFVDAAGGLFRQSVTAGVPGFPSVTTRTGTATIRGPSRGVWRVNLTLPNGYRAAGAVSVRPGETSEVRIHSWTRAGPGWPALLGSGSVELSFSFARKGIALSGDGSVVMDPDSFDSPDAARPGERMTWAELQTEARAAVQDAAAILRLAFPGRPVVVREVVEAEGAPGLWDTGPSSVEVGDIRISATPDDFDSGTLAFAYPPSEGNPASSDIVLNTGVDWRSDATARHRGGVDYSARFVVLHEILHALGVGHDADPRSVMFPMVGQARRLGPEDEGFSFEVAAMRGIYA